MLCGDRALRSTRGILSTAVAGTAGERVKSTRPADIRCACQAVARPGHRWLHWHRAKNYDTAKAQKPSLTSEVSAVRPAD